MIAWIALGVLLAMVVVVAVFGRRAYRASGDDSITVLPDSFTDGSTHHAHHEHHHIDVGGHHHGGDFGGGHHH